MPVVRIDSPRDPRLEAFRCIGDAVELARRGVIIVEGRLVVERLMTEAKIAIEAVLVTEAAQLAMAPVLAPVPETVEVFVVPQAWMQSLTGFNLHRGCVAVATRPSRRSLDELLERGTKRILVLEGVGNPDNVGGLFRTARAFAVDAIVLGPGCGDPFYRKAIRVSCGATLVVPFAHDPDWPRALAEIRRKTIELVALAPAPHLPSIEQVATTRPAGRPLAVMVGAEGSGLSDAALARADVVARIPIDPRSDSLNVTVAAAIALHRLA
jgi:tRNA G18 (ribose-2'-O)-methylase SpoU